MRRQGITNAVRSILSKSDGPTWLAYGMFALADEHVVCRIYKECDPQMGMSN